MSGYGVAVTPWAFLEDWEVVRRRVLSDEMSSIVAAVHEMRIWKSRCQRLPTGIESSLSLLEGIISYANDRDDPSVSLALATAVNRFLNVVSHSGLSLFGLTNYYDVARMFRIPDWLVDVRHETTHGQMPSKELLLLAVAFSLKWIRVNYWQAEGLLEAADVDLKLTSTYQQLHINLDCYRYLKIYSIWGGVESILDLRDQEELYEHVTGLLRRQYELREDSAKKRFKRHLENGVDGVKIREAANMARNEIHKFVCSLGLPQDRNEDAEERTEAFVENMIEGEMLLPSQEFLLSLCEGEEAAGWSSTNLLLSSRSRRLPEDLVKVWCDILQVVASSDARDILLKLLFRLRRVSASDDAYLSAIACCWISEICYSLLFSKDETPSNGPAKLKERPKSKVKPKLKLTLDCEAPTAGTRRNLLVFQSKDVEAIDVGYFCSQVLENPLSINTLNFIDSVFRLHYPKLDPSRQSRVTALIRSLFGQPSGCSNALTVGDEIKTVGDLNNSVASLNDNVHTKEKDDGDSGKWSVCADVDWAKVPFGVCPSSPNLEELHFDGPKDLVNQEESGSRQLSFIGMIESSEVAKVQWDRIDARGRRFLSGYDSKNSSSHFDQPTDEEGSEEEDAASDETALENAAKVPAFYRNVAVAAPPGKRVKAKKRSHC